MKGQRAVLTLTDTADGIRAEIMFEPSLRKRRTQSKACNAAMRLFAILQKTHKELCKDVTEKETVVTE